MTEHERARRRRQQRRRQQIRRRRLALTGFLALIFLTSAIITGVAATRSKAPKESAADSTLAGVSAFDITSEITTQAATEATSELETETKLIYSLDWGADDAYRLAKMAMAEAESEDTEGKALVILVILNRVWSDSFPGTIQEVIAQQNAFTSYSNGRYDRVEPDEDCWAALELIQNGWDESQGALYFERTPEAGESTWHSRNLKKLFTHGNHTFYTEKEADKQ